MTRGRLLVQGLILSLALNGIFLGIFFYFFLRESPLLISFDFRPTRALQERRLTNKERMEALKGLSFELLVERLRDKTLGEEGHSERDLALALLVKEHDFDLPRALGRMPEERLSLFPALTEAEFERVYAFGKEELFPQTSRGLFQLLKRRYTPEAAQAFVLRPEFIQLEQLFGRAGVPLKRAALLGMALEGNWELLKELYDTQRKGADFGEGRRREVLLSYIQKGSRTAAYLFLLTDGEYGVRWLEDGAICRILELLPVKTQESAAFVARLLASGRSEEVRKKAAERAQSYNLGEVTVLRPGPRAGTGELRPLFREACPKSPKTSQHVVEPGETLQRLAERYGVPVEELMRLNGLKSMQPLRAGTVLKIW